jgi:hypothetical protein
VVLAAAPAHAASVELATSSRDIYAGLPFTLSVQVSGWDETPEPTVGELKIDGCDVSFLGQQPSVQSLIQLFNGRQTETRKVTFVFRYRVTPRAKGTFQIPAVVVHQGSKSEQSQPAQFTAREVAVTADMQLRLTLPERPVWVGETFPVTLDWYLKKNVHEQTFVVPLFLRDDAVEVVAEPTDDRRAQRLSFAAGAKDVELGFERGPATLDGESYTRFRFHANVTANRAGTLELEPARVVASLEVGSGQDRFGFAVARTELFKAEDQARRLEVKALPLDGRPASFRGAVGTGFSIEVKADRSVVRMGDPIKLEVVVRGHGRLEGLTLPPLDVDGGLPREAFSVPEDAPPGELLEDGGKRFAVTVRVRSDKAREVPRLPFSFWNPVTARFETVRSQPIALAVEGSAVVGADSVVSTIHSASGAARPAAPSAAGDAGSLTGADLALSGADVTLEHPLATGAVLPLVALLYLGPFALVLLLRWRERTSGARAGAASERSALGRCLEVVAGASRDPGGVAASRLVAALEALRRDLARPWPEAEALTRCLGELAFDPAASSAPIDPGLLAEARVAAERFAGDGRPVARGPWLAAVALAVLSGLSLLPLLRARATSRESAPEERVGAARSAYQEAMKALDRDQRVAAFGRAEELLGDLARAHDRCPELLADWGVAALGAQDTGTAVLAFRRALALDPGLGRARTNLAWVEGRMPAWIPLPQAGALDSLAGWARTWTRAARALLGALAFALALLLAFAAGKRGRAVRGIALLPAVLWLGLVASLALERDEAHDAVLVHEGSVLRSADSPGAPAVLAQPLPGGVEVVVRETREGWARIELASGVHGWVLETGVSPVAR